MSENQNADQTGRVPSFYERPDVKQEIVPVAGGIPLGIESVTNSRLGIAGAYGAWGNNYDNATLPEFVGMRDCNSVTVLLLHNKGTGAPPEP